MKHLTHLIGQSVHAIDTPSLVIDLDAMERNLHAMAAFARRHHIQLRPHAKMHKSAVLAKLQISAGAVGVCVQKIAEAEALAAGGVHDIYISNVIVSPAKLQRVAALAARLHAQQGQLAIAVDSLEGITRLAQAASTREKGLPMRIRVLVEIDVGHGRCGVQPGAAAVPLVEALARSDALEFGGLQAYHGRAQHLRSLQERQATLAQVAQGVRATQAALHAAGYTTPLVTGGGTGTFAHEAASGVYGEVQVGSYLFMDRDYADNAPDPAQPAFEHALFVKSQVISVAGAHPASGGHVVIDAGHKSHAIDSGLPSVHGHALAYFNGGDEHGILRAAAAGGPLPTLGETVWLVPGHCDPTVNLHDWMIGVRGGLQSGVVEQLIRVDARGALT